MLVVLDGKDMSEGLEFEFEDQELEEVVEAKRKTIYPDKRDMAVSELYNRYLNGDLILRPEYQRHYVWDDKKASRLIESVFLNVPIPVIYLAEEKDGTWTVIDGQQRLVSLFRFLGPVKIGKQTYDEIKLRGLTVLRDELESKSFKDLPRDLQKTYNNASLRIILIGKESDPDIKFEVFERLNTGAVNLNAQEIRNCIYRGKYNDLINECAEDKDFLFLLGLKEPHKRMADRELVLRFFAFFNKTYFNYKPPMKQFLNKEMEAHLDLSHEEERELRSIFKKCIDLSKTVFGEHAFKRFIRGSKEDPNGRWEKKVNRALFDVVLFGFSRYEKRQIIPHSDSIREELLYLMTQNNEFQDTILFHTDKREKVERRFKIWLTSLEEIVGLPIEGPRAFTLHFKEQLWSANPTCAICNQRIHLLDDAEVDHIEHYWRGGKTIPKNARLVHRYCNRARGGREGLGEYSREV